MIKSVLPTFTLLKNLKRIPLFQCKSLLMINQQRFGPKKVIREQNVGSILIKNDNLKFETQDYDFHFYPFHPEVTKKSANLYQINRHSTAIAFSFILKTSSIDGKYSEEGKSNWNNRKSIAFKFHELSPLLDVNTKQDKLWEIKALSGSKQKRTKKILSFKNLKAEQKYEVKLEQFSREDGSPDDSIKTKMTYLNFQVLQFLLKESLYDLSGMKLMFDLRRNEELAKIGEKDRASIDKDDLFKNYDNKDDIV